MSMHESQAAAAVPILNSYAHSYLGMSTDEVLVGGGKRPNGSWILIVSIGSTIAECTDLEMAKEMIDERYDAMRPDRVSRESREGKCREDKVIADLERLARRWPKSLWLFSANGRLHVMRLGPGGQRRMLPNCGVDPAASIATIDIPNDGGDW